MGLRPAHQPALHAEDPHAQARRPQAVHRRLPPGRRRRARQARRGRDFKRWTHEELAERPGFNLGIWASVKDESLSDLSSLPTPEVIAAQIVEGTTAGIEAFAAVAAELSARNGNGDAATNGSGDVDAVEALLSDEPLA